MPEWLLLACLIPVIVVPVVLLFGFAGCDLLFSLDPPLDPPANVTATPIGIETIRLAWSKPEGVEHVRISRTAGGETTVSLAETTM